MKIQLPKKRLFDVPRLLVADAYTISFDKF